MVYKTNQKKKILTFAICIRIQSKHQKDKEDDGGHVENYLD